MCQAPKQKTLNHDWQDSLGFRIESWNDDAQRMKKFLFVGRQITLGGALKFDCWTAKDGTKSELNLLNTPSLVKIKKLKKKIQLLQLLIKRKFSNPLINKQ